MDFDARVDRILTAWADVCHRRAKLVLSVVVLLAAVAMQGLGNLEIHAWTESQLKATDPARLAMDRFRARFGNEDVLLLLLESDDLFSREFIVRLKALHEDLEQSLPFVDEITSLLNVRFVYGVDDELVVEDLLSDWPLETDELRKIERRARANPLYRNSMISEDGRHTAILVEITADGVISDPADLGRPLTNPEGEIFIAATEAVIARHRSESFPIWLAGRQPATIAILRALRADMTTFTVTSIALVGLLLMALFRRASGVLLPLGAVALTLLTTFGLMGLLHIPISPATQILPSFLIVVTVADAVHLLTIFYRELDGGRPQHVALANALSHTGVAILMTSVTTAACLASFMFADLAILTGFGLQTAAGVMVAFGYTFCLLPPLLSLARVRVRPRSAIRTRAPSGERLMAGLARTATTYPARIVVGWTVLVVGALAAAVQLKLEHKPIEWLAEDNPARIGAAKVGDALRSALSFELIIDSGAEGGLHEPEVLRRLDAMREFIETTSVSGLRAARAASIVDIVKESHQALNENRPSFFAVPDDRKLVAQELLLFEMSGSDDTEPFVDSSYRHARMTIPVPIVSGFLQRDYADMLEEKIPKIAGETFDVSVTGQAFLDARVGTAMITSMIKSYALALALLTPLMIALTRSLTLGLISIVPNVAPIVIALGLMFCLDLRLDMFSLLIGSLAIGIAVDDTIHILYSVKRDYARLGDKTAAIRATLVSTGRALLFTSVALSLGFVVFAAATMVPVAHFGLITASTIAVAFIADVTLSPALIALVMPAPDPPQASSIRSGLGSDARAATDDAPA